MELHLRMATEQDATACERAVRGSEISERYYAGEGMLARAIASAVAAGQLYVAVDGNSGVAGLMKVVPKGFCGLYPYLALLATSGKYRGKGVGSFLLAGFEQMGRDMNARKAALLVSDFNAAAKAFYLARGYAEIGLIADAVKPGIGEYLLLKDL